MNKKRPEAVNISVREGVSQRVDTVATRSGMSKSEWCRQVLDEAIDFGLIDLDGSRPPMRELRYPDQVFVSLKEGRKARIQAMARRQGVPVAAWLRHILMAALEAAETDNPAHRKEHE